MATARIDSPDQEDYLRRRVKAELRKRMRSLRATAPLAACLARSAKIIAHLEAEPHVAAARTIALFFPIEARHEVDLRALDTTLRARSVTVAYPAIDAETRVMTFRFVESPDELEERGFGFREPPAQAREAGPTDLDVIIVPALAIDPTGQRIGYGAGFYDRTLPGYAPHAHTIGVAFDYQLVAEVPVQAGDIAVATIVTDTRTLIAPPSALPSPTSPPSSPLQSG